jgi:NADPH2:quinone reductase
MKAIQIKANGGPEALQFADLPMPSIGRDTEVLVRVMAAGINPVDTKMRAKATTYGLQLPAVLGCDAAGVVEEVGDAVTDLQPGDAVYYSRAPLGARFGQYAEYAVVDSRLVAKKPDSLDFMQAAAAPLVLITAWEALHDRAHVTSGHNVLVHAGAGGVGHVAIQLARLAGAQVATTVSDEQKGAFVESLGADYPIYYKDENFSDEVMNWTDGEGADIAFDTVGGKTFEQTMSAVRYGGDLVTLLQPPADTNWAVARARNLRVSFELMLTPLAMNIESALDHQGEILRQCARLIDEGKLRIHVHKTFPLALASEAHRLLESGQVMGKLVLTVE